MIYTVTLNPTIDRTMRFPRLVIGALNRATSSRCDLSGKGVNVSVVLRRLGVESVVMGLAGGLAGRVLVEGLRAQGHRCDFVEVAGETRSNVTVIDEATGVTTKLNEPGPTVTEADLQALEERLLGRLQPGDVCVFSGSLPPGAPEETYARFITQVHRRGGLAVLDTSDQALAAGCAARPEWIKPNQVEAEALIGRPLAAEGALVQDLRALLALGAQRVLLSLGSRGAAYADGTTMWLAEPPPIVEVSAVGAGDALLAAALWAWQRGLGAKEIVRWAVACGTAAALEDGTAMPSWERVQEMYGGVQVRPLNSGSGA
jgi:1-phosphofructokinase